jgi:aminoglycoside/choline kinase family phosphotransferase
VEELGLDDYRDGAALIAEWPEHAGGFAAEPGCLSIALELAGETGDSGRIAIVEGGADWLTRMPMSDSVSVTLPDGAEPFLASAGWAGAAVEPLLGDASFRRYFRIRRGEESAMLMDAPPPAENPEPFLRAARWLDANGMRAPRILADDTARGLVLLEDFGAARMRDYLDEWSGDEEEVYRAAVDTLVELHRLPAGPFPDYGMQEYLREARLLTEWYCPAQRLYVATDAYAAAWEQVLAPLLPRQRPGVTVLRDYHAENIMLLGGLQKQGLLDFQDALAGHRAYDLVSLLQDARREVSRALEAEMIGHYLRVTGEAREEFLADYARLGAQRNAKIVGIFVRLWRRDGKPRYLELIPRVWALLERDLAHPALAPVARWFDANIPAELRDAGGGSFAA